MYRSIPLALALGLLCGAAHAAGITADPGTECQWSSNQRVESADCPPTTPSEYVARTEPDPTLFPEMNIREQCATLGVPARPYCEARNFAAREQLVALWGGLNAQERRECAGRTAPLHARYVVIVSCAQAKLDRQAEASWRAQGY